MRLVPLLGLIALALLGPTAPAQTPDDVTKLIDRVVELDSIDIAKGVKFRPGLEPALFDLDADESKMVVLKDPYEIHGRNTPGAAGWYRVSFVVPEKLGKFAIPKGGYNLGIESNVLGSWELYVYNNEKRAGLWSKDGMYAHTNQPPTAWMSNAPMPTKAGDRITIAVLGMSSPLGRGSPEGFGLRHLRIRFALAHTGARQPFFGSVYAPGQGTGLFGARERLRVAKGDELLALQERLRGPLSRTENLFKAADTGQLDALTKAMAESSKEINAALKK
jgi:hypothetical protein